MLSQDWPLAGTWNYRPMAVENDYVFEDSRRASGLPVVNPGISAIWTPIRAAIRQIEFRRQVELNVEHNASSRSGHRRRRSREPVPTLKDVYVVTVTNKSPKRDIVVNRVWFDTTPTSRSRVPIPVRIEPEASWSRDVPVGSVPGTPAEVQRLGRCELSPDNKIIESHPGR